MLKNIITAVVSALKSALRFMGRVVTSPLKLLGGGGNPWGMAEAPEPEPLDHLDELADRDVARARSAEMANLILTYAAESVVEDAPAPLPAELSPDLKKWARGLSRSECEALMASDERAISAHIAGIFMLPNVRKVEDLPTAHWPREPSPGYDDGSLDADLTPAVGYGR